MANKWMLIGIILFIAVVVAGCSSIFTFGSELKEKQMAREDMIARQQIANESTISFNQLIDELESIDYESDENLDLTPFITLIEDDRIKINNYIDAEMDYKNACRNYSIYLDQDSMENKLIENNLKICDDNIKTGQDTLKIIGTVEEWLNETITWKASIDNLTAQYNKTEDLSTGSDYYQWLIDTQPILDAYLVESNTLSSETDMVIAVLEPGATRQSCVKIKSTLQTSNDQLKGLFNQMVDHYNTNLGSTYGIVPRI